jgi:hypothetical protein
MTNKERAEQLRDIAQEMRVAEMPIPHQIEEVADELDPPRPELGTVVWCLTDFDVEPEKLFLSKEKAEEYNREHFGGDNLIFQMWLPGRILADDEADEALAADYQNYTADRAYTATESGTTASYDTDSGVLIGVNWRTESHGRTAMIDRQKLGEAKKWAENQREVAPNWYGLILLDALIEAEEECSRLRDAIKTHRGKIWGGAHAPCMHLGDRTLYAALQEADDE